MVDEICAQEDELMRLQKLDEFVDHVEDMLLVAYLRGREDGR